MDSQFWIDAWKEGKTGFNQAKYNDKLLEYFPQFNAKKGQKVLVPLCGKTIDMLWLHDLGLQVRGIELYEEGVKSFFSENKLSTPQIIKEQNYLNYTFKNITLSCGDFFNFNEKESFEFIYDRAAMVALPKEMRNNYAKVVRETLKKDGKYLLITYEYDSTELEGPPFSVEENEIHALFEDQFDIKLMESAKPNTEGSRLSVVGSLIQKVYILKKN